MPDWLGILDHPQALPKGAFKGVQRAMLEHIALLSESIYEQKRSAIIVFEGWDAAGKGTTIRALTERLDARGYKVLATQAPRTHEKQKPWLWRFWMNIPRYGQIAIFDRSWYGRVLVERVYGLTPMPEWIAAYEEINQFERTLADDGAILIKFWLHIAREEQLRRFIELAQDPATAWQVTAEDWENHRRYDDYLAAVRDMLANTNTPVAPWFPIDATNREYRMYSICRTLIERLEDTLGADRSKWPSPEELEAVDAEQMEIKPPKSGKKDKSKEKRPTNGQTGELLEAKAKGKDKEKGKEKDKKKDKKKKKSKHKDKTPDPIIGNEAGEYVALPENSQEPANGGATADATAEGDREVDRA